MDLKREKRTAFCPSARRHERPSPPVVRHSFLRPLFLTSLGAALGIGAFGEDARAQYQCKKTGAVDVVAISQAEYETLAAEASTAACVTPRSSGLTVCQLPPLTSDVWTVVAEAPEGGGDAQYAVELDVYSGPGRTQTCDFTAGTPVENTDSRWIKATTSDYELDDNPPPIDFVAVVQIGPEITATVCPYGDGAGGHDCSQWNGNK